MESIDQGVGDIVTPAAQTEDDGFCRKPPLDVYYLGRSAA